MTKQLIPFGVSVKEFQSADAAMSDTYRRYDMTYPPTPLIFPRNLFNEEIKNAKTILEIGCGCGRNINWIMENTDANYIGIEPNPHMSKYIQDFVNQDYLTRCAIGENFSMLEDEVVDVILSIYVFQHIGYRPQPPAMNIDDTTNEIKKYTHDGTIWFLNEHENEEPGWINRWLNTHLFIPDVYKKEWRDFPELLDRGDHSLLIIKEEK